MEIWFEMQFQTKLGAERGLPRVWTIIACTIFYGPIAKSPPLFLHMMSLLHAVLCSCEGNLRLSTQSILGKRCFLGNCYNKCINQITQFVKEQPIWTGKCDLSCSFQPQLGAECGLAHVGTIIVNAILWPHSKLITLFSSKGCPNFIQFFAPVKETAVWTTH